MDSTAQAAPIRLIGLPGRFAEWGLTWARDIIAAAGAAAPDIVPAEPGPADAAGGRSVVFLDSPAAAALALLPRLGDPIAVARELTRLLAPLPALLARPGTLLVRRGPALDLPATRAALARHLLPDAPPPADPLPCEAGFDPAAPEPPLSGQMATLARQVLQPMFALALGDGQAPVVWPLACFYAGDQPGEQAAPVVETEGPARILYYGPYFHLPAGRFRVDVQMFFSNDVPASMFAAEIVADAPLARIEFRPEYGGLFQASMPLIVERADLPIEFRIWLLSGTLSGQFGLRQVLLTPLPGDEEAVAA